MSSLPTCGDGIDDEAVCAWMHANERGGWVRAYVSIMQSGGGALRGMDWDDLVAIFTRLGPCRAPDPSDAVAVAKADAAADELARMLSGLTI